MSPRRRSVRRSEAREVFNHFDRNKNGNIDKPEFWELSKALGAEMSPEELDVGWSEVDKNNNGRISFDEFFDWWSDDQ